MVDAAGSDLEEVRNVLLGDERAELAALRSRVEKTEALEARVEHLENLLLAADDRSRTIGDALVGSVVATEDAPTRLGLALQPTIEHAIHESARSDDSALADALYPILGPTIRKMIAGIFTLDRGGLGQSFAVDQVLLVERRSGVLLVATTPDEGALQDADVVAGMLDAIRLFVQDAFEKPEHDGLQDLRVGDTSVLVEWGPKAVLTSVVRGIPSEGYRNRAAIALETIHLEQSDALDAFDGDVGRFEPTVPTLEALVTGRSAGRGRARVIGWGIAVSVVLLVALITLLAWLL